jgi:hypothetical protein
MGNWGKINAAPQRVVFVLLLVILVLVVVLVLESWGVILIPIPWASTRGFVSGGLNDRSRAVHCLGPGSDRPYGTKIHSDTSSQNPSNPSRTRTKLCVPGRYWVVTPSGARRGFEKIPLHYTNQSTKLGL